MADTAQEWTGVDFDGTLSKYTSWKGADHAGAPVKKMVDRVKRWLKAGKDVRIFTARVGPGTSAKDKAAARKAINDFCEEEFGQKLEITATKDQHMTELWDDRAVQVKKNTGEVVETFVERILEMAEGAPHETIQYLMGLIKRAFDEHDRGTALNVLKEPLAEYGVILTDGADQVMQQYNVPAYVNEEGMAVIDSRMPLSQMELVLSHEMVHVDQMQRAADTGDVDKMFGKPLGSKVDVCDYANCPHEAAAWARTKVDTMRQHGITKDRGMQALRVGSHKDPYSNALDAHRSSKTKKRIGKHMYRYAQDLPESESIVVGVVTHNRNVIAQEGGIHRQLPDRGASWRYVPLEKVVYWHGDWSEHDEVDEQLVVEYLAEHYGYEVVRHVTLEELAHRDYFRALDQAHGRPVIEALKVPKGQTYHVKPGDRVWFEYHCTESHTSADAHLWYRSHRPVTVGRMIEPGYGKDMEERGYNGHSAAFKVRFEDGYEDDATEDELMFDRKEFSRPKPPKPPKGASMVREDAKRLAAILMEEEPAPTENKVDSERIVRHILENEEDMPSNIPAWPEFAHSDEQRFEAYKASLPVVYVDDIAYRFDMDYMWLLPLRDKGEPMRFASEVELYDYLDAHSQYGADLLTHAHQLKDTETASIPMEEREPHVVYRTGDYAFLKLPEDEEFIRKEGKDMQHCLAWAQKDYCQRMRNKEIEVYSMTDTRTGIPVVDIEVALTRSSYGGPVTRATVTQLRGIRNECPPRDQYLEPISDFLENYGKDWELKGIRSFDGKHDGEEFLRRLNELRGVNEALSS